MLEVHTAPRVRVGKAVFASIMKKTLRFLKLKTDEANISVALVDDKVIRALNKRYRGKDRATDVLSFEYGRKPLWGEVIISYETADRQAKEYGHSVKQEMQILFAHGLLHIAGYDHKKTKDKTLMREAECEIVGQGLCERSEK